MTAPHFDTEHVTVWHGDCIDVMRGLPDASVDAVVTDPPYGLGFMGHKWDTYTAETGRAKSEKHSFDHIGGNHNPVNSADQARTRRAEGHKFEAWGFRCIAIEREADYLPLIMQRVSKPHAVGLDFGDWEDVS